jgi:uncharacterized surface protein with fasciclin (FAS1) repeats
MRSCFIRGAAQGLALAALGFLLFLPAAGKEARMKDLTDTVGSKRILSKFAQLLVAADLASFTSSRGPLTLFVPTNSAFTRIPPEEFAALLLPENKAVLQRIVLFHLVNGQRLTEKDLAPLKTLPSCEGSPLPLRVNRAGYQVVGKAKILEADIRCLNGLLHEIDGVLLPPGVNLSALPGLPPVAMPASEAPPEGEAETNGPPEGTNGTAPPPAPTNQVAPSAPATNLAPVAR